jgi:hypothetical protein
MVNSCAFFIAMTRNYEDTLIAKRNFFTIEVIAKYAG